MWLVLLAFALDAEHHRRFAVGAVADGEELHTAVQAAVDALLAAKPAERHIVDADVVARVADEAPVAARPHVEARPETPGDESLLALAGAAGDSKNVAALNSHDGPMSPKTKGSKKEKAKKVEPKKCYDSAGYEEDILDDGKCPSETWQFKDHLPLVIGVGIASLILLAGCCVCFAYFYRQITEGDQSVPWRQRVRAPAMPQWTARWRS